MKSYAPEPFEREQSVRIAIRHLRAARDELKRAGALRTLERVRAALRSAGGAERNATSGYARARRKHAQREAA